MPRLLGIGVLAGLAVVIGLFARWDDNPSQAATDAVSSYGLGILVPFAALWLGTSAIGDLVEDRLLVYLWLKPVRALAASGRRRAGDRHRRRAPDRGATCRRRRSSPEPATCALRALPRRLARRARVRRPVRRGGHLVPARRLVGARLRAAVGERRRAHGRGRGALHGERVGRLRSRPGSRRRRVAQRPGLQLPRSSCSRPLPSSAGWWRPGATAAPTWTDVRASAAGRRPGTSRRRTW